ncbi:MAG: FAD binding domain-containing protein [Anaerolineae bacterium]
MSDQANTSRDYYVAASIEEALGLLVTHRGQAQIVAGGTRLRGDKGQHPGACCLVDVSRVGALRQIARQNDVLALGGSVTLADILRSDLVVHGAPLLVAAAEQAGSAEVRARATLAGSIVSAEGNSPVLVALVTLGTEVEITNLTGAQRLPLQSLWVRSGVSRVDSRSEIVTGIYCPVMQHGQGGALAAVAAETPGACADLIVGVQVTLSSSPEQIVAARVAVGSPHASAHGLPDAGRILTGASLSDGWDGDGTRAQFGKVLAERVALLPSPPEAGAVVACALRALDAAVAAAMAAAQVDSSALP